MKYTYEQLKNMSQEEWEKAVQATPEQLRKQAGSMIAVLGSKRPNSLNQEQKPENQPPPNPQEDVHVLKHIKELTEEEQRLYTRGNLSDQEVKRLHQMKVELDQCWDLLRQREALRDAGRNPNDAKLRPPDIVENYEQ